MSQTASSNVADPAARLTAVFRTVSECDYESRRGKLQAAVAETVAELKAAGLPPERVLAEVKHALFAALPPFRPAWQLPNRPAARLQWEVTTWVVERYFRGEPPSRAIGDGSGV